jgi:SSS family solute:Na+ symporter
MTFWKYYLFIHIGMAVISIVWFTWGGFKDLAEMMKKLRSSERDHGDDGWVSAE